MNEECRMKKMHSNRYSEFKDLPDNNLQTMNLGLNFESELIVKWIDFQW